MTPTGGTKPRKENLCGFKPLLKQVVLQLLLSTHAKVLALSVVTWQCKQKVKWVGCHLALHLDSPPDVCRSWFSAVVYWEHIHNVLAIFCVCFLFCYQLQHTALHPICSYSWKKSAWFKAVLAVLSTSGESFSVSHINVLWIMLSFCSRERSLKSALLTNGPHF